MVCASTEKCIHIYVCLNNRMHTWMYSFHRCPSIWFSLYHPSRFFSTDSELLCFWNPYTEECTCAFLSIHERVLYFRKEALYICKRAHTHTHTHSQHASTHKHKHKPISSIQKSVKKNLQNCILNRTLHSHTNSTSLWAYTNANKKESCQSTKESYVSATEPHTHTYTPPTCGHTQTSNKKHYLCVRVLFRIYRALLRI